MISGGVLDRRAGDVVAVDVEGQFPEPPDGVLKRLPVVARRIQLPTRTFSISGDAGRDQGETLMLEPRRGERSRGLRSLDPGPQLRSFSASVASTPFTKAPERSVLKVFASRTASATTTAAGVSVSYLSS